MGNTESGCDYQWYYVYRTTINEVIYGPWTAVEWISYQWDYVLSAFFDWIPWYFPGVPCFGICVNDYWK